MKAKINSYIATLLVTIVGAGASLLIIHVATDNAFASTISGGEVEYASLQESILQ